MAENRAQADWEPDIPDGAGMTADELASDIDEIFAGLPDEWNGRPFIRHGNLTIWLSDGAGKTADFIIGLSGSTLNVDEIVTLIVEAFEAQTAKRDEYDLR